jgi:hypothetical protein
MLKLGWLWINSLSLAGVFFANYIINSSSSEGSTIGEISELFSTYVTPADYAFSIWGLIYLGLILFLGFQWYQYLKKKPDQLEEIGAWFLIANLANAGWVFCWTNLLIGASVLLIFLLLLSLINLVRRLNLEVWDAPVRIIVAVWWPIVFYLGWIILASVVNVAAYLVSVGWEGGPMSEETWAILLLITAMLIYLAMIFFRNLRESALVGAWGISAIAVKYWGVEPYLAWTAIAICVALLLGAGYHGYVNRETSPVRKWQRGEI